MRTKKRVCVLIFGTYRKGDNFCPTVLGDFKNKQHHFYYLHI